MMDWAGFLREWGQTGWLIVLTWWVLRDKSLVEMGRMIDEDLKEIHKKLEE